MLFRSLSGETRMRVSEPALANHEIVESLIGEDFTTADDEDLIKDLEKKLEMLGLDPSDAKDLVLKQKRDLQVTKAAEPFKVLPQKEWQENKRRLVEKVNSTANMLLNRLELKRTGREIVSTGVHATNNYTAAVVLINQELKKKYPKPRNEWTNDEFLAANAAIDEIINKLTRTYKKKSHDEKETR